MLGSECLHDYFLVKILDTLYCTSVVDSISHRLLKLVAGGIKHVLCDFTGRGVFESAPGLVWTSPHVPISFAHFALYPVSAVNHIAPRNN